MKATLAMMSYLVKHPKNPDGIEVNALNAMSDEEIIDAYLIWKEKQNEEKEK